MTAAPPVQQVEVSFVGLPPVRQIRGAAGVSHVEAAGSLVRCRVTGSFQPFLEALRGHEVVIMQSVSASLPGPSISTEGAIS